MPGWIIGYPSVCRTVPWPSPTPLQHPAACRLLLKPVCSSPGCQGFPVLLVPPLLPSFPFPSPSPSSSSSLSPLRPVWALKIENRVGCGEESAEESKVYLCLPSESFFFIVQPRSLLQVFWWNSTLCGHCRTVQEQTFSSHVCLWNAHSVCHTGKMECSALSWCSVSAMK